MIAIYQSFRRAIEIELQVYHGKKIKDPLLWIIVLTVGVFVLAYTGFGQNTILTLAVFIIFIKLLTMIVETGDQLYHICPQFELPKKKVRDSIILIPYIVLSFALIIGITIAVNHKVPSSDIRTPNQETAVREQLLAMGFPKKTLDDLSDEHVLLFQDAIRVEPHIEEIIFDFNNTMIASAVLIELPNRHFYMVESMEWPKGAAVWNDNFTISGKETYQLLDGKMLWDNDGVTHEAKIKSLSNGMTTTDSLFFGQTQEMLISGNLCFPFYTENQRAYVLYEFMLPKDIVATCNILNYYHKILPIQLPFDHPEQSILDGKIEFEQHYTNYHFE